MGWVDWVEEQADRKKPRERNRGSEMRAGRQEINKKAKIISDVLSALLTLHTKQEQ